MDSPRSCWLPARVPTSCPVFPALSRIAYVIGISAQVSVPCTLYAVRYTPRSPFISPTGHLDQGNAFKRSHAASGCCLALQSQNVSPVHPQFTRRFKHLLFYPEGIQRSRRDRRLPDDQERFLRNNALLCSSQTGGIYSRRSQDSSARRSRRLYRPSLLCR